MTRFQSIDSGKPTLKDAYDVGEGKKKTYSTDLINNVLQRMRKRRMKKRGLLPDN